MIDSQFSFTRVRRSEQFSLFKQGRYKQLKKSGIKLDKIVLLDSQSTMCLYGNKDYVSDIRKTKEMVLSSNGGTMKASHQATLEGYGNVTASYTHLTLPTQRRV